MLTLKEDLFIMLHYSAEKAALVDLAPGTSELIAFGGTLAELTLAGRVRLEKSNLVITDNRPLGDTVLDEALTRLPPTQPVKLTQYDWILPIARTLPVGYQLFARLLDKGILHREEERTMFGLSRSTYYPLTPGVMDQLVGRIRHVMIDQAKPNPHTATLLFMMSAWGTSGLENLSNNEKKAYHKRWNALFSDYWGQHPSEHEIEPVEGLDPAARQTIGCITVSWASSYVMADFALWRHPGDIDVT